MGLRPLILEDLVNWKSAARVDSAALVIDDVGRRTSFASVAPLHESPPSSSATQKGNAQVQNA